MPSSHFGLWPECLVRRHLRALSSRAGYSDHGALVYLSMKWLNGRAQLTRVLTELSRLCRETAKGLDHSKHSVILMTVVNDLIYRGNPPHAEKVGVIKAQ